jgi:hypothetical protein
MTRINCINVAAFQIITAVTTKSAVFCNLTPYNSVKYHIYTSKEHTASIFRVKNYVMQAAARGKTREIYLFICKLRIRALNPKK